jgi:hypothetical protein
MKDLKHEKEKNLQRPSNQGYLDSSLTGSLEACYTGVDLFLT